MRSTGCSRSARAPIPNQLLLQEAPAKRPVEGFLPAMVAQPGVHRHPRAGMDHQPRQRSARLSIGVSEGATHGAAASPIQMHSSTRTARSCAWHGLARPLRAAHRR